MKNKNHILKGLLFCGFIMAMIGSSQAVGSKWHTVYTHTGNISVHEDDVNLKRPNSKPMGLIGGGKRITGYDNMNNPVIESSNCPSPDNPAPCT